MAVTTIYPTASYWHEKVDRNWSSARNAPLSDNVNVTDPASTGIKLAESNYFFRRTYLSFDLASIPGGSTITGITMSLKRVDKLVSSYSPILAYSGSAHVKRSSNEYPLYIDNQSGKTRLSTITLPDDKKYYTSSGFNIKAYPVSPGDIIAVGVIDPDDFNEIDGSVSDFYQFDTDPASDQPYIEVTYNGGGYANPIMGISNFTELNGVSRGSIINVMGI